MRLINTIAVVGIAAILWSVVVGFGVYEFLQFQKTQVDVANLRGAVNQIAQIINNAGQQNAAPSNSSKTTVK
jgi:hypothetical protein